MIQFSARLLPNNRLAPPLVNLGSAVFDRGHMSNQGFISRAVEQVQHQKQEDKRVLDVFLVSWLQ